MSKKKVFKSKATIWMEEFEEMCMKSGLKWNSTHPERPSVGYGELGAIISVRLSPTSTELANKKATNKKKTD